MLPFLGCDCAAVSPGGRQLRRRASAQAATLVRHPGVRSTRWEAAQALARRGTCRGAGARSGAPRRPGAP